MSKARRLLVVVNPNAGGGRLHLELAPAIASLRAEGHDVVVRETGLPGEARALVRRHADRFDRVVACGGDGTLSEVAAGLLASGAHIPLALVPAGTGNDFAQAVCGDMSAAEALRLSGSGAAAPLDVGFAGPVPFVNAATGGFAAEVSRRVNPVLKAALGRFAYVLSGVARFGAMHPFDLRISGESSVHEGPVLFFAFANGRSIGGGSLVAPDALVDDGLLDLVVLPAVGGRALVGAMRALRKGLPHPAVIRERGARFLVEAERALPLNCDGEAHECRTCEVRVARAALSLVVHGPAPARSPAVSAETAAVAGAP